MPVRFSNIPCKKQRGGLVTFLLLLFFGSGLAIIIFDSLLTITVTVIIYGFLLKFFTSREAVKGRRHDEFTYRRWGAYSPRHEDKALKDIKAERLSNVSEVFKGLEDE